ncbi:MAG: F0F1 ATP synthase subunit B [Bacilli bacterium]|nr:F0F1 ATP synthase subunit B [Bacilli bacterium]
MPVVTLGMDIGVDKESFLDKLFPNPWDALAVFLAFIILLIAVFFFAYKPVKKLLKQRGDYVEGKIKSAEDKEREATRLLDDANEQIKEKKIEAMGIVEKAKEEANLERQAILEKAKKEKEAEVKKAKEEIAQEIEASKDEIHREIVSVAIDASSKVLEREVTKKDNEKLIDSFIDDLKEGK